MRHQAGKILIVILLAAAAAGARPSRAVAQPMMGGPGGPDLRAISGRPLPDAGMPTGTISVRVARKIPSNAVAGAEVTALVKNEGGDIRKRTAKTDGSGRALFEGVAPGSQFVAQVSVDGEALATQEITVPPAGGIRTMLIAGLGPAPAGGAGGGAAAERGGAAEAGAGEGEAEFSLGASSGAAHPDPSLPTGTLEVHLLDEAGQPIKNAPVLLGAVDQTQKLQVHKGRSNDAGVARFSDLPTGPRAGYAAVIDWRGLRIGTEAFSMPEKDGATAEIRALARTTDPSVITVGAGGRLILQMHEDALVFAEMLPLENTSDKIFDPGPGAIEIPLPEGFVSAEAVQTDRKVEVRQNHGVAVHGAIAPRPRGTGETRSTVNEVTIQFVLPSHGDTRDFEQRMPNGSGPFTLFAQQIGDLSISGPGVGPRESREISGHKYWLARIEGVPPGGTLRLNISGLPSTSATGRNVAGGLAIGLILAVVVFGRRPRDEAREAARSERDRLTARRETLFAELVAVEQAGRAGTAAGGSDRRRELFGKLEGVYQQLAALDDQRGL